MLLKSKSLYVLTSETFSIKLEGCEAETIINDPKTIVWKCQGMRCLIRKARVVNMAQSQLDQKKFCTINDLPWTPELYLDWDSSLTLQKKNQKTTCKRNTGNQQTDN